MGYFDLKKQASGNTSKTGGYFDLKQRIQPALTERIERERIAREKEERQQRLDAAKQYAQEKQQEARDVLRPSSIAKDAGRGIWEGAKGFGVEMGKAVARTGAMVGDIGNRLSPVEGARSLYSGAKTIADRQGTETIPQAFSRGVSKFQARPLLYEKLEGKFRDEEEYRLPELEKISQLVTDPEYRKPITAAAEAPTYLYGGKAVEVAGKNLLSRILARTVATQPEALIESGLQTAGEEKPTIKSGFMNYLGATLLMSGISNTVGEIKFKKGDKEVSDVIDEVSNLFDDEAPSEAFDDVVDALNQGVKKETIIKNAEEVSNKIEVKEPVREPRTLQPGELARETKAVEEITGELTTTQKVGVRDSLEKGDSVIEIADELINPRVEKIVSTKAPKLHSEVVEQKATLKSYKKDQKATRETIKKEDVKTSLEKEITKAQSEDKSFDEFVESKELTETLRGTKGLTADDIQIQHPNIKLKRDVPAKDIHGNKVVIPDNEVLTPYELKGNKVLLQDGETYIVSKNQFANIKGQSVSGEAKPFAPELKGTEESIKTEKATANSADKKVELELKSAQARDAGDTALADKLLEDSKNVDAKFGKTKYSQYQLPDGKNYKEILIKAPVKTKTEKLFLSSHWDEPNVISHLRMNERTYKGKKVAFMEELQSDWAREGRDKGFTKEWTEKSAKESGYSVYKAKSNLGNDAYFLDGKNTSAIGFDTKEQAWEGLFEHLKNISSSVPNNPLLKNWQEPAVKRALREAVESDASYFSWINGEQTSARYNLSTQIDNVNWNVLGSGGTKRITIKPKGQAQDIFVKIDKKGKIIEGHSDWKGKKLDEAIGKGLADKIMGKSEGKLSGEGLKFGGEWAGNLYDKQVANIVKKLTGGKVEVMDLGLPVEKANARVWWRDNVKLTENKMKVGETISRKESVGIRGEEYVITDTLGEGKFKAVPKDQMDRLKTLDRKPDRQFNATKETFDISTKTTTQQGIKLTPEIKAKIKGEGLDLKTSGKKFDESAIKTRSQLKQLWEENKATPKKTPKVEPTPVQPVKEVKPKESITAQKMNDRTIEELSTKYDIIELKNELNKASKAISENKTKAVEKVFSETGSNTEKIAIATELFEKAIREGDARTQSLLFDRIKKLSTETAQSLNMFKAMTVTNPHFKYMKEVVDTRLGKIKVSGKDMEKALTKKTEPIVKDIQKATKSKIKVEKAQSLLDKLIC